MFLAFLLSVSAQVGETTTDPGPVPWVVVEDPEYEQYDNLLNPQLVALRDGTLVACYQHSGHYGGTLGVRCVRSEDRGLTWRLVSVVKEASNACVFVHDDALWLLGLDRTSLVTGAVTIRRSKDRGATWTTPSNKDEGRLRGWGLGSSIASAPCIHDGRIWRAFTNFVIAEGEAHHSVLIASADLGSDLMHASNWRFSSEFPLSFQPVGYCTLVAVEDEKALVLMVRGAGDRASSATVSSDGWRLSARRLDDQVALPETANGARVIRDAGSGRSFVLTSEEVAVASVSEYVRQRNVLSLFESTYLIAWTLAGDVLHDTGGKRYRFAWSDALADGEDLLALLSVTFVGDEETKREWGRKIVFLRVPKFRERTSASTPLWGPAVPR